MRSHGQLNSTLFSYSEQQRPTEANPKESAFAVMQPATRGQSRRLGLAIVGSVLIKSEPGTTCLPPPATPASIILMRSRESLISSILYFYAH